MTNTEDKLKKMLEAANLAVKPSYNSQEVCLMLGISKRQFWRLIERFESDESGNPLQPDSLDSFMLRSHRRVTYPELISFLVRNQSYERINSLEKGQVQLELW